MSALQSCPVCKQYVREDDPCNVVEIPGYGMNHACRACKSKYLGSAEPDPVYPPGEPVPMVGDGMAQRFMRLCGVCRRAMHWDQAGHAVRIQQADLDAAGVQGVEPGVYIWCGECKAKIGPAVRERVIREFNMENAPPLEQMDYKMCL